MKLLTNMKFAITVAVIVMVAATAYGVFKYVNRTTNESDITAPTTPAVTAPQAPSGHKTVTPTAKIKNYKKGLAESAPV